MKAILLALLFITACQDMRVCGDRAENGSWELDECE